MLPNFRYLVLPLALISTSALAEKNADLKISTPTVEKPTFTANFDASELAKPWSVAKGDWVVKDGTIVGKEKAEDKHNAVLSLALPKQDSVIRFSFKLDGAKFMHLSFNHAKGHLFRVVVAADSLLVTLDKDKKDESSKAAALGKASAEFTAGKWFTMQVELKGEKVIVQTDNGAKVEASSPALKVEKTGYRFVTKGESLLLDDIKVWDVAP